MRRRASIRRANFLRSGDIVAHDLSCWRAVHCPLSRPAGLQPTSKTIP